MRFYKGFSVAYNLSAPRVLVLEVFQKKTSEQSAGFGRSQAVSNKKILSLVISLAFLAGVCAPRTALGDSVVYESAATRTTTTTAPAADADDDVESDASDEATQPKKKGNSFARALSAPFRALARLFGGGRKKPEEAKRREPPAPAPIANAGDAAATQTATQTANTDAAQAAAQSQTATPTGEAKLPAPVAPATVAAAPATTDVPPVAVAPRVPVAQPVVAPKPSEETRIVRPNEEAAAPSKPGIWIPVIEGISKDPLTQGRALLQHGYVQEAIAELTIAASQPGPELVEANNLLGIAYDRMGWHIQAIAAYERALSLKPKDAVVVANLGYSLYLENDFKGALKRLKQADRLAPGTPIIYNNIAIVEAQLHNYGTAFKYFARASNEFDAHLKLAAIFEFEKRDDDAIKHYEAALRLQPGTNAVLERLVVLYERTGRPDKADTARRALGQPKNPQKTTTGGGG